MFKKKVIFSPPFVSIFLILLWLFLTLIYIFNYNLSTSIISYSHPKESFYNYENKKIHKGDVVIGEIVAQEDNMGILSIGFNNSYPVPFNQEDILVFRIKEKGAARWYYENEYRSGVINEVPFFPFGFPLIKDSGGKTFIFEIESLKGNDNNAVSIKNLEPVIVSRYQIEKQDLLGNNLNLINFFIRKIVVSFTNNDVLFFSIVYALPVVLYLLSIVPTCRKIILYSAEVVNKCLFSLLIKLGVLNPKSKKSSSRIKTVKLYINLVIAFATLTSIFIIGPINEFAIIVLILLWIFVEKLAGKDYRQTYFVGLFFLTITPLILIFNFNEIAEKSAVWAFMFFVIGTIQRILELRNKKD